ncbi:MAG: hypothetical protein HGGPFJEG_02651 [Ignavibacteria bacterium]|nr:hypothetical protein [Ignavibacteria bacterium]
MNQVFLINKKRSFTTSSFLLIIIILFSISNVSFSQGRRDRLSGPPTYVKVKQDTSNAFLGDTLYTIDSTRLQPVDSTARIKYFKYVPEYTFGTKIMAPSSPLLLENSSQIKKDISFDTDGNVIIKETFDGDEIRAPLVVPLDVYLNEISKVNERKIFSDLVAEKFKGNTQDDLTQLFEKFTDITIPLPFKSESIFGPPTFNLKLNGAVDITASFQNSTSDVQNTFGTSNSNSAINFKQEVQLTAKGVVGDKLTIDADYNTQRLFDFENQLKLKYEGYADEVIKKIEGGNVTLETSSGLISSSQALFGVRGDFQLGSLSLSAVVSQKKSKTETKDYSGGAQEQVFNLKVWDYSDNHYFLDTIYKARFLNVYNDPAIDTATSRLAINDQTFEVWVQTENTTSGYRDASLIVDLPVMPAGGYTDTNLIRPPTIQGISTSGKVRKLSLSEYSLDKYAGFLALKINIPENYFVGVAYSRINTGEQFGTISTDSSMQSFDTLILKMVKVQNLLPTNTHAWNLKMKNIYKLPVTRVIKEGFEFGINFLVDNVPSPNLPNVQTPLIHIMGLDKYTNGRTGAPDNLFDFIPGVTIDPEGGFVIFPTLQPFYENFKNFTGAAIDSATYWYPEIYSSLKTDANRLPNANNYSLVGKARGEAGISNTINLGFNIVEGSVVIRNGNIELIPNVDYTVDYSTGTVVIKNASALLSKDLKISFEQNDLFTLASKTFIGLRGSYKISDRSSLGFTYVNLKQETLNDKVRIGEEPTNNSMYGIDFSAEIPSKMLTGIVNLLPGYNTKEISSISFRGELAAISPDPNTLKSEIPGDNNEAIAYIDDMEGAKKIISLGGTYNSWTMASVPLSNSIENCSSCRDLKNSKRGKIKWFNISNSELITNIYPEKVVQAQQNTITPFYIAYNPNKRGTYNYNGHYDTIPDKKTTWNGIMKYLNTTNNDLVNENINFIEFSMKVEGGESSLSTGKLIIDLGNISQDAIPNGKLDTEDSLKNGELRQKDDIGLDYHTKAQEDSIWIARNPGVTVPEDPALDNFVSTNLDPLYEFINGTEGNSISDVGRRPDTEDLNRQGNERNGDDYFQFEVDLNIIDNPYIVGQGLNGWRQYKIPLSQFTEKYGNAVFTNIQFARLWITGVSDSVRLTMYDMNLTGNQWVKNNKTDTTYNITTVNLEENSTFYSSPVPGDILRQTVRGQNNVNTLSNEQSLSLVVSNLTNGVRKIARKDFSSAPLDLFNYRTMKLFVNGDPSFNYTSDRIYDATMVIRFGNDSNNYYEYRAPIHPDVRRPDALWNSQNQVTINFDDLTKIKLSRDSSNIVVQSSVPSTYGPPGAVYEVYGNPDLKAIREIILGVEKNRSSLNSSISGSVWFNEVRLINVIDDNGIAFNASANIKLADLLDFRFGLSKTDPFFHTLDGRIGSRTTGLSWDFSTTLNLHKIINNAFASFLSDEWSNFLTLPITYTHSENMINPRYFPGTDIALDKAAEERYNKIIREGGTPEEAQLAKENLLLEAQSLNVRNNLSITGLNFNFPTNNYFIKNIINKFLFNFNFDLGDSRDLTYENKDDSRYSGGVSFGTDFGLADILNLNIGKLIPLGENYSNAKLYFCLPFIPLAPLFSNNFSASMDYNRLNAESKQRRFLFDDIPSRSFTANRGFRFDWKFLENWIFDLNGNYEFRAGSDLTNVEVSNDSVQKSSSQIFNDIFFTDNGLINWGKDLDYIQNVTMNPRLNIPFIDRFLTVSGSYNVRYGWINPNQSVNVGYNVGYTNSFSSTGNLKLKEIFNLFGGSSDGTEGKLRANGISRDSVDDKQSKGQSLANILKIFGTFIPNDINITFTQDNSVSNAGVTGLPGFGNFWFYPTTQDNLGPSRLYQLGLSLYPGQRAPNLAQLNDSYTTGNSLSFQTTINPIIPEFVTMSLNFKTGWGFSNNLIYQSDGIGNIGNPISKTSSITSGNSMFFAGNAEDISYSYDVNNVPQNRRNLSSAFQDQVASFPFPNWSLTISGLERFPFFSNFATSVTLDNTFISDYRESRLIDVTSYDIPNQLSVIQSFSPLLGLNINFKEVLGGNLTSSFRLNTSTSNTLSPIAAQIQTINTSEWSINANFTKTGFSIPLFGLSLQNDISFALTLSKTTNEPINYELGTGFNQAVFGNGSSVTNINPSIQYSLSSKVSMQLFYKYIKTEPTGQTLTTVPRTSNEGGLNIRITIQ